MDNRLASNSEKSHLAATANGSPPNQMKTESRLGSEMKGRKLQKADREKLRRCHLNEQFTELGKTLDPERPKFDKATILVDTIQMLNDLTSQVERLKSEYTTLTKESIELTQEKHELREEKASLKSDIENLNLHYQQRIRTMYPWVHTDQQSVVMQLPSYPYPVPVPIPPDTIPMHPSIQPYPFFGTQNARVVSNPCSPFYQPVQYVSPALQPSGISQVTSQQGSRNKSLEKRESGNGKDEGSNEVATELELKTPGSTSTGDQDSSPAQSKSKKLGSKQSSISDGRSPSGCSSSGTVQLPSSLTAGTNSNS